METFQKHAVLLDHLERGALSGVTEKQVEEFICRVYSSCTNDVAINEVRYRLFQKDREKLPPSPELSFQTHPTRPLSFWYLAESTSHGHASHINNGWYKNPTSGQLYPQLMVEDPLTTGNLRYCVLQMQKLCKCKTHLQIQAAKVHRCMLMQRWYLPEPFTTMDDEESD